MADILIKRFEQYFRHPDRDHDVLRVGDRAVACGNVRRALQFLDVHVQSEAVMEDDIYDQTLEDAVRAFQVNFQHRVADGLVGAGSRERLVSELLHRFDASIFNRLHRPEAWDRPSVFISYASVDRDAVNKLDQWLRDHGLRVVRDCQFFIAGSTIQDNIVRALARSDKILAVFSRNSRERDWPKLERALAEQVEERLGSSVLIYLCLDDTELPAHDSTRLAIRANGKVLSQVGAEVLHAVAGVPLEHWRYAYSEDEPL